MTAAVSDSAFSNSRSLGQDVGTDIDRAKSQALYYLKFRSRSSAEMDAYLTRKGFERYVREEVLDWLRQLGYIDDLQFARNWIQNRIRTNPMGERRLVQELRQKGIPKEVIEKAVEEFRESVDERDLTFKVAAERARIYADEAGETAKRKLTAYLLRRGFGLDDVRNAVERVLEQDREEHLN
ncbi:MAG: regulatory protein RecX [Firmicutes bacterium]|nr:regulatory protein RecX [Bacillota bacterium]